MGSPTRDTAVDPLAAWINQRERDFRDFEDSLSGQNSLYGGNQPFSLPSLFPQQTAIAPRSQIQDYQLARQAPPAPNMDDKDLSPRAKVTIDEDKLQVQFQVKEYKPEELSIKTEGDVLVVLGKQEVKEGGQSYISKQFEQRFSLPSGAKPENISSALSKDGVLTVTAARDPPALRGGSKKALENTSKEVFQQSAETRADGLPHPRVEYDEDKVQISMDARQYKPDELDVKVEGNNIIISAKQAIKEGGETRTRIFEQKFSMPSGVQGEKVSSTLSKDGVLTITAPRGAPAAANTYTKSIENSMNKVLSPSSWDDDQSSRQQERSRDSLFNNSSSLSSGRHGSIFDAPSILDRDRDSFFDRKGSLFDNERSLLAANSESNGVSRVEYDANNYKIHVNVKEYKPEELVVKTVDNNKIQVEAKHEEKTSNGQSYSTKSFSQSFTLPKGVNPDSISSALSKEGVLTISAPLPPALKNNSEKLVPIKYN